MPAPSGMLIDAVFASEAIDSSGEVLDVKGADVSNLEAGMGQLNYEHKGEDEVGASGNDWVGRIVYVKKIFSLKDCDNERQEKFWKELEIPFIYGICRLYDSAGHRGAQALAAIIRDHHANGEKILYRYSVEGTTLKTSPDKKHLLQTLIHNVALTRKPCNRTCDTGILSDPQAPEGFEKAPIKVEKDFLDDVLKRSEQHFHPNGRPLGAYTYIDYNPEIQVPDIDTVIKKMEAVTKAITAGSYNAAPGTLTGGAALQREDLSLMMRGWSQKARKALSKWDGTSDLKEHLKHEVPEASDQFIDRFKGLVDKYQVGKKTSALKLGNMNPIEKHERLIRKFEALTIELKKAGKTMFAAGKIDKGAPAKPQMPASVKFRGKNVKPGMVELANNDGGNTMALLHVDHDHLYAVPPDKISGWTGEDLKKLPRRQEGRSHYVHKYPETIDESPKVDERHVTHYNDEKQKRMILGMEVGKDARQANEGFNASKSHWQMGAHASPVYVKRVDNGSDFPEARREVVFHNLARDFFGLGQHVPNTAHMIHPKTGEEMVAVEGVHGHHMTADDHDDLRAAGESGDLSKMALMDLLLGNSDRHSFNYMMDDKGKVKLIDHGSTFEHGGGYMPAYLRLYHKISGKEHAPVDQVAQQWVQRLDPAKLQEQMKGQLVPQRFIDRTVQRIMKAKAALAQNPNLSHEQLNSAVTT